MNKVTFWLILIFFFAVGLFLTINCTNTAYADIININSRTNNLSNPVQVYLDAGTYIVEPIGVNDGGTYDAWSAWSRTTCTNSSGCPKTSPTTYFGWMNQYDVISQNITFTSVDWDVLPPLEEEPTPHYENYFLVTENVVKYKADDSKVYPNQSSALSNAQASIFTVDRAGLVGFSIDDRSALYDNRGGISLNVKPFHDFNADEIIGTWSSGIW